MLGKTIQQLIKGKYVYNSKLVHVPVKSVKIEAGLIDAAAGLIGECGLKGRALIVSDVNTHAVLGNKIFQLIGNSSINPLIFESGVKSSIENVQKIKVAADLSDYIIAVGSGTINDLCKYASFLINKPYVVFGTAPSMNGYGSANSSITVSGHKKTLKAHLPSGIFLDLDVLVKAPIRLIRSGLGDSLCRPTAQADWLLSHLLLGTFYTDLPFGLLRAFEADLFANSKALVQGDTEIMRLLAGTLVLSGFGMYLAGGSYPASQGEHMIAHTMEMAYGDLPHSYHGEQIGVTTLTMAKLQENIVQNSGLRLQQVLVPESLTGFLDAEISKECIKEYSGKQFPKEKIDSINFLIQNNWDNISQQVSSVMLPYNILHKTLKDAGCPLCPEDIGWQKGQYENALRFAKFTRDRFTFLDLV